MPTMRRIALLVLGLCVSPGRPAPALQTGGTAALSAGSVRTSDGAVSSALTASGGVRLMGPASVLDAQALLSALPHGAWNTQLYVEAWRRISGRATGGALALSGSLAGSALPEDALAGSAQLLMEGLYQRITYGTALSAGPVIGSIRGALPQYAMRVRARAWLQEAQWRVTASFEPTFLDSAWYADASLGGTYERGRFSATLSTVGRLSASDPRATAGAFAAYRLSRRVALEGGYGGFLPDPFLGFASATSGSVGVRMALGSLPPAGAGPLVALRRGSAVVVQVRVRGAAQVSLAGEWANWTPMPLRRIKPNGDLWEGTLTLPAGTYRFNVIVDGTRWTVPEGVASVPDGLGGQSGVLVVP